MVIVYRRPRHRPRPTVTSSTTRNAARTKGRPAGSKDRLPRLRRGTSQQLPGMVLTPRDYGILEAAYAHRVLSSAQVEALLFTTTTPTQCRTRLRLLFQHGYLLRLEQLQRL